MPRAQARLMQSHSEVFSVHTHFTNTWKAGTADLKGPGSSTLGAVPGRVSLAEGRSFPAGHPPWGSKWRWAVGI
jgi:hypothetical protein